MFKKKKKTEYRWTLHGMRINTRSNRQPPKAIGYAWEPCGSGGRVWRIHTGKRKSWVCDTVLLATAERMATALHATCGG